MQQKKETPTVSDFNEGPTASDLQQGHLKQVHWALKFIAISPFDKLRAGELLMLKEDLYEFTVVAQAFRKSQRANIGSKNIFKTNSLREYPLTICKRSSSTWIISLVLFYITSPLT